MEHYYSTYNFSVVQDIFKNHEDECERRKRKVAAVEGKWPAQRHSSKVISVTVKGCVREFVESASEKKPVAVT